jgi:hypothetical protein
MAKIRLLKKDISKIAGDMFLETLFMKQMIPSVDAEKADALLSRILEMQDTFLRRSASPAGKDNKKLVKEYYKKFDEDFSKECEGIYDSMSELAG